MDKDIFKNKFKKNPQNKLKTLRQNTKIINPIVENMNMADWEPLYRHDPKKLPNENHICKIVKKNIKKIYSNAADVNDISSKTTTNLTKTLSRDELNQVLKSFR